MSNSVKKAFQIENVHTIDLNAKLIWLGYRPELAKAAFVKKGKKTDLWPLVFENRNETNEILVKLEEGEWLTDVIKSMIPTNGQKEMTFLEFEEKYNQTNFRDFDRFLGSKVWRGLLEFGLVLV